MNHGHTFYSGRLFFQHRHSHGAALRLLRASASVVPGAKARRAPQPREPVATRPTTTVPAEVFERFGHGSKDESHMALPRVWYLTRSLVWSGMKQAFFESRQKGRWKSMEISKNRNPPCPTSILKGMGMAPLSTGILTLHT